MIPTDGFVTPEDPSKTMDADLMKRLQALRESGSLGGKRSSSSKSYASSTESISTDSTYVDDLEDLLSDDVLVDDVIVEEQEDKSMEGEEQNKNSQDVSDISPDVADIDLENIAADEDSRSSTTQVENAQNKHDNSTTKYCQDDSVTNNDDKMSEIEDSNIDSVVTEMREELEEAMGEGEELQHNLEEQIKKDMAIGQGEDTTCLGANQDADEEEDVDRRSSADSGVQEDRTDGDESSGTQSASTPVSEDVKSDVANDLANDNDSGMTKDEVNPGHTPTVTGVTESGDSSQRTIEYSGENDVRTLEQNENDDEVDTIKDGSITKESEDNLNEVTQEAGEEDHNASETDTRTVELEVMDSENRGDVDGGLDETEEERIARLQEEALARHLKTISKDVLTYMGRYMNLF